MSMSPGAFMGTIPALAGSNTPWGQRYARELRDVIIRQASRQPRSMQVHLGPSELGIECDRRVVGKFAGEPKTNHVSDPWPSVVGTSVHAWLAEHFELENSLNGYARWITERRVAPHPFYPGTADLYDGVEEAVVDWKILGPTSLAKVMSPAGPPRHYKVQLLLYALGYRNLGAPVSKVCLAALPRTASSLDQMFLWVHDCSPADDELIAEVLDQTAFRREVARRVLAGQINIGDVPITPSDDGCYFCLSGDTEITTRDGIKPISELAGTQPQLLVPRMGKNPGLQAKGDFVQVPVRELGTQRLWEITLTSRRAEKIVYATAEHRWLLTPPPRPRIPVCDWPERTTQELQPGDRLRSLRAALPAQAQIMPPAIAQGFVYGDGTRGQGNRPATLSLYDNGKDEALLPFFPLVNPEPYTWTNPETGKTSVVKHIYGLPRFWKDLPPLRESRTFLLSWLAGYFAADGTVSEHGQVLLDSADAQALRFVRDVAAVCGIGYSPVRSQWRTGTGSMPTQLWSIGLRRRDLPGWFFLTKEHARRAAAANEDDARGTYWTVRTVRSTDRIEPVYCATVPGAGMFGLADDLLTGNCEYYRPESARDYNPGCPGHSPVQS